METLDEAASINVLKTSSSDKVTPVLPLIGEATRCQYAVSINAEKMYKKCSSERRKPAKTKDDDLDTLISEFTNQDSTCAHPRCNKSVTLIGFKCSHCSRKHCVEHNLPEIHGCGDNVKRAAKSSGTSKSISTNDREALKKRLRSIL